MTVCMLLMCGRTENVDEMIRTYHITDVVFAQNACDMGVDGYDRAWQGFKP